MSQELAPVLRRHYPQFAKDFLAPMVEMLSVGRQTAGNDLDKLLILLVVALRTAEDKRSASLDLDEILRGDVDVIPSLSTNVRSIADSTGIPKESVRRKVAALIDAGLIRRDDNALSLAPQASRVLTDWRERLFDLAIRYRQLVAAVEAQDG
jgi:hypothetical protein